MNNVCELEKLPIPKGIRYLSEWVDFTFDRFPEKCIIDKQIPGCGYTEWCIFNADNVILASPRRILLQNKRDQHENEVYLVVNELEPDTEADKDISSEKSGLNFPEKFLQRESVLEEDAQKQKLIRQRIYEELQQYFLNRRSLGKKILVTYDSYRLVKSILKEMGLFNQFYTVVDEFQTVLHDSRFKSDTELNFMRELDDVEKVHFVSATPTLEKYIRMLPDFMDLPYYEFDWASEDPSRVKTPDLKPLTMKSVGDILPKIIEKYKKGDFETTYTTDDQGNIKAIVSDEAVFYVNSVKHIISAIQKCNLKPEEVNILCSNTPDNIKKINTKLNKRVDVKERGGSKFEIGGVPLEGVKPKMFTFCTRTVYLGADFYSLCARSFIFSDSNLDCLAVDIKQDIPQILGRQRLKENPWKNSATFYYRTTADYNKMSEEEFNRRLQEKLDETANLLSVFDKGTDEEKEALLRKYKYSAEHQHYKNDYVAVTGRNPCKNQYAYVSDVRAFDIQQKDYVSGINVFTNINQNYNQGCNSLITEDWAHYNTLQNIYDRLEFLCKLYYSRGKEFADMLVNQISDFDSAKTYYKSAGPEKCRALGYNVTKIKNYLSVITTDLTAIDKEVLEGFKEGNKYPKVEVKSILQDIYDRNGYGAKAKATDLERWFEIKSVNFMSNGKKTHGFEILKRK